MYCSVQDCDLPVENYELMLCASHNKARHKKSDIKPKLFKPVSNKKMKEILDYSYRKKKFFKNSKNQICGVCGRKGADSIHHKKGKVGYADHNARDKGITLLNDERFWLPIHSFNTNPEYGMSCHHYVEVHPIEAKEKGWSLNRLDKK